MDLHDAVRVEAKDVEEGHLGVPRASVDPVGVEAEADVARVRAGQHVVQLASGEAQLGVVVVVGELHSQRGELPAEPVEGAGLRLRRVGLVLGPPSGSGSDW
ncbi:MAG: hypothetical protein U0599_17760 [Vicinamibacteria bacterium]